LRPHDESAGAELIGRREESDSSGGPHTTGFANQKGTLRNHDYHYKRNGTATLFAAMDALDGAVISMRGDRHRHQEWLKFLRVIDEVIPPTSKSPNRGQVCDTQTPQSAEAVGASSQIPHLLHADQ